MLRELRAPWASDGSRAPPSMLTPPTGTRLRAATLRWRVGACLVECDVWEPVGICLEPVVDQRLSAVQGVTQHDNDLHIHTVGVWCKPSGSTHGDLTQHVSGPGSRLSRCVLARREIGPSADCSGGPGRCSQQLLTLVMGLMARMVTATCGRSRYPGDASMVSSMGLPLGCSCRAQATKGIPAPALLSAWHGHTWHRVSCSVGWQGAGDTLSHPHVGSSSHADDLHQGSAQKVAVLQPSAHSSHHPPCLAAGLHRWFS